MWPNNAQQTSESIWKTYTSFTALSATQLVAVVLPQLLSGQFLSIPPGSTQVYLTHLTAGSLQKLTFLSTKNGFNKKKPKGNTAFFSRSSSWPSDDASRWWLPKIPKGHLAVNCTFARRRSAATRSPQVGHTTGYLPLGQLSQDDSHHWNLNIEMRKRIHIYNMLVIGKLHMFTRIRFHNTRKWKLTPSQPFQKAQVITLPQPLFSLRKLSLDLRHRLL